MIATGGASGPSAIEKKRPRSSGVPMALKKSALTSSPTKPQALGNRSVVPFDSDDLFPAVTNEQIADDAGALHTRNRLNLFRARGGKGRSVARGC